MKNIELYTPDFSIECEKLNTSGSVYQIMRDMGIKRAYVYGMLWKSTSIYYDFIKVGRSCPNLGEQRESQVGERLVRQLSWVPGWNETLRKSDHGFAFWQGIQSYMIAPKTVDPDFDKNSITVAVWDVTARMDHFDFISDDEELKASMWYEGSLADQYKKANRGKLPPLNHVDPSMSRAYRSPKISKVLYTSLFEEQLFDNNSEL